MQANHFSPHLGYDMPWKTRERSNFRVLDDLEITAVCGRWAPSAPLSGSFHWRSTLAPNVFPGHRSRPRCATLACVVVALWMKRSGACMATLERLAYWEYPLRSLRSLWCDPPDRLFWRQRPGRLIIGNDSFLWEEKLLCPLGEAPSPRRGLVVSGYTREARKTIE